MSSTTTEVENPNTEFLVETEENTERDDNNTDGEDDSDDDDSDDEDEEESSHQENSIQQAHANTTRPDPKIAHHHNHHNDDNNNNNFAVIVSTSRYWFNYRHHANALSLYQLLKDHGHYDDDHIALFLADDGSVSMNPRNPVKNKVYNTAAAAAATTSLYRDDTEIDFRGDDVTVSNFLNVLTGRSNNHHNNQLLSLNENSNVLIYLTGHGGDTFLKFRDTDELTTTQFASALVQMQVARRYRHVLVIADTCQAFTLSDALVDTAPLPSVANDSFLGGTTKTMASRINDFVRSVSSTHRTIATNVTMIGSALRGESSYAHTGNPILGLSVIEKYTHFMTQAMRQLAENGVGDAAKENDGAMRVEDHPWNRDSIHELLVAKFSPKMLGGNMGFLTNGTVVGGGDDSHVLRRAETLTPFHFFFNAEFQKADSGTSTNDRGLLMPQRQFPRLIFQPNRNVPLQSQQPIAAPRAKSAHRHWDWNPSPDTSGFFSSAAKTSDSATHVQCMTSCIRHECFCPISPGIEPNDPKFIGLVLALLIFVLWASRQW